jgi:hypothetical protein
VAAVALLVVGAAVAMGIGAALGLSFTPSAAPAPPVPSNPSGTSMAPVPHLTRIDIPADPRVDRAARVMADAMVARGAAAPTITSAGGGGDLTVRLTPPFDASAESYRIRTAPGRGTVVEAGDLAGAAQALYAIADRIRAGAPIVADGTVQRPRLGLRLTDAGAVGWDADPAKFAAGTDYSLNTDIVAGAALPRAPWVDAAGADQITAQFRQFVDHSLAQGYNGIVVPGFLEYVTFAKVGDGHAVYPAGDPHIARAQAMVAAFGPMLRYAHDAGMRVFLLTDMLAVSPPLESYLNRTYGGLVVDNPALWTVYQAALAELFEQLPFVDGLMVRVGEGGAVYQAGWDYSSRLAVTTAPSVQQMLRALLSVAGTYGKDIIFRSWTVGVGPVGDLHINPASYEAVLGAFDDPHLIVSTKYVAGDFYSHLPLNPTLAVGTQRRIIEFQARREFEGFGSLPDNLLPEEQQALRQLLAANPHIEGVWNWTQDGGPLYAGPRSLYLRTGFWPLYDLNTYGTARLAWQPDADPTQLTSEWVRQTFSADPATADAITTALNRSRDAITRGLYIGPYAENSVKALGLAPPPMMWIFEWDIVTGDSAALDSIYAVSRGRLDEAIADGGRAVDDAVAMRRLITTTPAGSWYRPELRQSFVDALDYEVDLLQTLAAYRTTVLRHAEWLDTGASAAYDEWQAAQQLYDERRAQHVTRYGGDLNWPAYNFTAADLGSTRADRDVAMAWCARGLLGLLLAVLLLGFVKQRQRVSGQGALRALWTGATRPWRLATIEAAPTRLDRVLVVGIPAVALLASRAVFTWFAAPAHLIITLGAWLLFAVGLRVLVRGQDPYRLWAAVGGVALLRTVILLLALVTRGPGRYWFDFWTEPTLRSVYVTVAFAAFGWLFVVVVGVLRTAYGYSRRRSLGTVMIAGGATLGLLGCLVAGIGLERALTIWNDQLALLPWGLSRILGITVYLGIPPQLPTVAAIAGLVIAVAGAALSWRNRPGQWRVSTSARMARRVAAASSSDQEP